MRNEHIITGDSLYLKMPNADVWVTASLQDHETLAPYRWRWISSRKPMNRQEGYVATATVKGGVEVLTSMDYVLFGTQTPASRLARKNDNPADCRRENIRYRSEASNENTYTTNGEFTYLHLNDGYVGYVDTEDLGRIRQYFWKCVVTPNTGLLTVLSSMKLDGRQTAMQLGKFLLGVVHDTTNRVVYANGNRLDLRKENLY